MPMELLEELADMPLPCEISRASDIEKLRVLEAAAHVVAVIQPRAHDRPMQVAHVLEITPLGRKALRFFGSPRVSNLAILSAARSPARSLDCDELA